MIHHVKLIFVGSDPSICNGPSKNDLSCRVHMVDDEKWFLYKHILQLSVLQNETIPTKPFPRRREKAL